MGSRRISIENGRIGLCAGDPRRRFPLLFPLLKRRNSAGHRESAGRQRRSLHARPVVYQPHEEGDPHVLPVLVVSLWNSIECSEDCTRLVEEELVTDLQLVDLPIFTTCPLFKQRLFAVLQALITSFPRLVSTIGRQTQKTVELVRQLLAMELTLVNVRHPDFNGTHIEKVRVEAAAAVQRVEIPAGSDG